MPYFLRLILSGLAAIVVTFFLGVIVAWMNGFIISEDQPLKATRCYFNEDISTAAKDVVETGVVINCSDPPESGDPILQWFQKFLPQTAQSPDQGARESLSRDGLMR